MSRKRKDDEHPHRSPLQKPKTTPPTAGDEMEYTEFILVAHAANPAEAELIKMELKAHGIMAILEGEGAGVAGIPDVGAGVPVLVPEEFADQAAELIAELEAAKPEGSALDKDNDFLDEAEDLGDEPADKKEEEEEWDEDEDEEEDKDEDLDDETWDDEDWDEEEGGGEG